MALVCKENLRGYHKFGDMWRMPKKKAPGGSPDAKRESLEHNTTLWHEVNLDLLGY
jgi:hypothetical protein